MADDMTAAQRSYTMSRIRSARNQSTELRLLRLFRTAGLVGWRRGADLPGRPDFVFRKARVAVFVDGCFWHGCSRCALEAKSNKRYWLPKIARNVARDRRVTRELRSDGWVVVRIWEHMIRTHPGRCLQRVRGAVVCSRHPRKRNAAA
jgi:DNA mismatch endonuclease (patch repair protein)